MAGVALAVAAGGGRTPAPRRTLAAFGVDATPFDNPPQPQPQTALAGGIELAYVEQGQGTPVVFVHGSPNDFRSWGFQLPSFAPHYRAIAYSRRAHWPNAANSGDALYAATRHADDLAALIDALGLGSAHLVGASYGALVALLVASKRPELVRTLVVGEPPLLPWLVDLADGPALLAAFTQSVWEPVRQAFARGEAEAAVRLFLDGAVGAGAFDRLPQAARTMMLDNAPALRMEVETPADHYFLAFATEDARGITTPTLLLDGEHSPTVFQRITDQLAIGLLRAERVTIPATSHALHVGNPQVYNETVLRFLAMH
jgi:pimeloyl-ACP methyl ester carboxylesterase